MQTHKIKVINNNPMAFTDRYDGIQYRFNPCAGDPKKGVTLELEAATHIFGVDFPADAATCASEDFRERIWDSLLRRWGWSVPDQRQRVEDRDDAGKMADNRQKFDNIEFRPVIFQITEVITGGEDNLEEPREQRAVAKSSGSKFKPRVEDKAEEEVA